jgi:hydrogenase expression/formation protein HypC
VCLAVPAEVISLDGNNAIVELNGVRKEANVAFIDGLEVGDYVLVHAGFAIQKWSQEDVDEYRAIIEGAKNGADAIAENER